MLRTMAYNEEGQRVLAKKWVSPNNCLIVRSKHFDQALSRTDGHDRTKERPRKIFRIASSALLNENILFRKLLRDFEQVSYCCLIDKYVIKI